jgi:hypothetical protein
MKQWIAIIAAISISAAGAAGARAQFTEDASADSTSQQAALSKVLSDRPFFGTRNVLTLSGDYVNTPKEDFEQSGKWTTPLTLDQMHGAIAEVAFGEAKKQGEWQLSYRHKLMAMDSEWRAIADSSAGLTLSDRRSQVLKASYNVRDWWKLGIAAVVEDRPSSDNATDPSMLGLGTRQGLGFQIDTSLKF